jgi:PadR family transcriptional regulator PadR
MQAFPSTPPSAARHRRTSGEDSKTEFHFPVDIYIYICRLVRMNQARKLSAQTLALLAVLIEQPRKWRHGYDLSRDTGLKSGTLYPIMMRLCDRGLLESKWEAPSEPGRPPRHIYKLTPAGCAVAKGQLASSLSLDSRNNIVANHT